ncbi:helix-turn-helix domain-containing protein [Holdemanella sp.]|uniref:helix-turn-helix domain-containing protein n=1 Tax=Holdemanella sp. TaxID=1971762 RepID=UPI002582AF5B|nr:helix-turn-helix domain-containing protein [Holdemanella sp.]
MEYKDMELKDIIKFRRKELNLNLLDIAKACDVSEATVSRWESGNIGDMKRSRIAALSKILKISPAIIVGTTDNDNKEAQSLSKDLSDQEKNLLEIYRVLDDKGQHTVDTVTQMEYERVKGGSTAILKK